MSACQLVEKDGAITSRNFSGPSTCGHGPGISLPPFTVLLSVYSRRTLSQYSARTQSKPCFCNALGLDKPHGFDEAGPLTSVPSRDID